MRGGRSGGGKGTEGEGFRGEGVKGVCSLPFTMQQQQVKRRAAMKFPASFISLIFHLYRPYALNCSLSLFLPSRLERCNKDNKTMTRTSFSSSALYIAL